MDSSLWEDLESHQRPRGVSEAERKRAQGPTSPPSTLEGGDRDTDAAPPSPLSADADQRLRDAVYALRLQQPDEFSVYARMAQIEKQLADVIAIVEVQSEVILRLSKKAAA